MDKYVTDTQALVMFANGLKVINDPINKIFLETDQGLNIIIIPAIVVAEIAYLNEKGRIPVSVDFIKKITSSSFNYVEELLSIEIIKSSFEIKDIPELHDRLIAGTARYLELPFLTNDPVILKSKFVTTIKSK